jgi:HEAT repeat protein
MRTAFGVLILLLCFSPDAANSPLASRQTAGQTDVQKQAWEILREGANSPNMDKRANAVQALGLDVGDLAAVQLAEIALEDKEAHVRAAAAKVLGALGSAEAVPYLRGLIDDKDISVALAVGHALVQLKSEAGYDVYYSLLVGTRKGSTSIITRELDQMKTPGRAIRFAFDEGIGFLPYGGYGLEALREWERRSTAPSRAAAARELAGDPDARSGQALAKAVSDKEWMVRAAAVEAIAKRGDAALLVDIVPAMTDKKEVVRYSASAAVIRLSRIAKEKGGKSD